jgi:hypothetical protein
VPGTIDGNDGAMVERIQWMLTKYQALSSFHDSSLNSPNNSMKKAYPIPYFVKEKK